MTGLLGMTELLAMMAETADRSFLAQQAQLAHAAAQQINSLLENLLTWSRLQASALTVRPNWVVLGDVAAHVVALWQPAASAKNLTLCLDCPDPDAGLNTDAALVEAILRNLLGNAIKFTPSGGSITVHCTKTSIGIADSGPGLPADRLASIMEGHLQHPAAGSAGEQGSGLGLSLCHTLARHLGGSLLLQNRPQGGLHASLHLPDQG